MLSFSCFLNVLTLRDNLISFGKEFQKPGPDVFIPLDAKFAKNVNFKDLCTDRLTERVSSRICDGIWEN